MAPISIQKKKGIWVDRGSDKWFKVILFSFFGSKSNITALKKMWKCCCCSCQFSSTIRYKTKGAGSNELFFPRPLKCTVLHLTTFVVLIFCSFHSEFLLLFILHYILIFFFIYSQHMIICTCYIRIEKSGSNPRLRFSITNFSCWKRLWKFFEPFHMTTFHPAEILCRSLTSMRIIWHSGVSMHMNAQYIILISSAW